MINQTVNPELIILDVGHGNCAILIDSKAITVIDCAPGVELSETLRELGITEIEYVLISHADKDHIGGLEHLLLNFKIHHVYVNTDTAKKSKVWRNAAIALDEAKKSVGTITHNALTPTESNNFNSGQAQIEILAPSSTKMALVGPGGFDIKGRKITTNTMSVVVGILHDSHRVALLTGDLDNVGLDNLLEEYEDIEADLLVFPHHGGRPLDADSEDFARKLCSVVKPKQIVFSLARMRWRNPREEIVKGCLSVSQQAHILCTQLSRNCAKKLPIIQSKHLVADLPAKGITNNETCAGTIHLVLSGKNSIYNPTEYSHLNFVTNNTQDPLCLVHRTSINTYLSKSGIIN